MKRFTKRKRILGKFRRKFSSFAFIRRMSFLCSLVSLALLLLLIHRKPGVLLPSFLSTDNSRCETNNSTNENKNSIFSPVSPPQVKSSSHFQDLFARVSPLTLSELIHSSYSIQELSVPRCLHLLDTGVCSNLPSTNH